TSPTIPTSPFSYCPSPCLCASVADPPAAVQMELVGAREARRVVGVEPLPGRVNYFIGSDPRRWHTGVPTYAKVRCEGVYPGIDQVFYGSQRQLEYDFVLSPGADPSQI